MTKTHHVKSDHRAIKILLCALVAICLTQALVLLLFTAQSKPPSANAIHSCVFEFGLRPKFPRPTPDPCVTAPINHLSEA